MSTTGGGRRPARAEVRRAVLDAAARVFARRGIDTASLEEVAAEAGMTKGAIYSNFTGKAALVETVVEEKVRANLDAGLAAVEVGGSMPERAQALGDGLSRAFDGQREWHLLYVELWQRAVRTQNGDTTLLDSRRTLHETITAAIAAHAEDTGTELAIPPDQLATVLIALSDGFSMEQQLQPGRVPADLFGRVLALLARPS
ncbi:TetR/AcrR family transcriptional regulator [Nocardioides sp. CFH 31398]|uniref:TetR/AcrR family transcriptional regulator n=1 Tax=Nocardioides sp. CFH 31398 TaxID=2919579 RepID=UPI001F06CAA2|nr:TetR/AcrR family transcriptional regulator [Nocardioides sp. CFH 31398]MCH1867722.1 TetR/AcrR family transcriptional regulator [Nocardioides sp. CFH 31398]